jgi:hypothetical protein
MKVYRIEQLHESDWTRAKKERISGSSKLFIWSFSTLADLDLIDLARNARDIH